MGLMRRLTSMKRSKSPPPSTYSMDNPVFEDTSVSLPPNTVVHPVHIRYFSACDFTILHPFACRKSRGEH